MFVFFQDQPIDGGSYPGELHVVPGHCETGLGLDELVDDDFSFQLPLATKQTKGGAPA